MEVHMKRSSIVGLILLGLLLVACGPSEQELAATAAAQTAAAASPTPEPTVVPTATPIPYDLTVTVTDEEGAPIVGASIVFPESGDDKPVQADDSGQFTWNNLGGTEATLKVSGLGYMPAEQSATLERGPNEVKVTMARDPFGLLPADACAPGEALLYGEDFQDGLAQGWPNITAATDFAAANGWSVGPAEDGNKVLIFKDVMESGDDLQDFSFDNAVWRLKVRVDGSDGFSFLNWRHAPSQGGETRYPIQWGDGGVQMALTRLENPGAGHFVVGQSSLRSKQKQWYYYEISTYEGQTQVWVNGKKIIDYKDPKPLPAGTIGLEVHMFKDGKTIYYFDDMAVCELKEPFTSLPMPTPAP
jgi:hypothetical protein